MPGYGSAKLKTHRRVAPCSARHSAPKRSNCHAGVMEEVEKHRVEPPVHALRAEALGQTKKRIHRALFFRQARLQCGAVARYCIFKIVFVSKCVELIQQRQHGRGVFRPKNDAVHIAWRKGHAADTRRVIRVRHKHLSRPQARHHPLSVARWNIRAAARADDHFVFPFLLPRSGLNKTAPAAVLHGSMFSKPCAPAQGRVPCTRAAVQAAPLRLLYHDAAKRPQQNRTRCGFAWFNVLKALRDSTAACAMHARGREAAALRLLYHIPKLPASHRAPNPGPAIY